MTNDQDFINTEREKLFKSLLYFTQVFFKLRTGREYVISNPICRESHHITICKALVKVIKGETKQLLISIPPRYGKTELVIHFIAWAMALFPDSNFIYTSYSYIIAQHQAQIIRDILSLSEYKELFDISLNTSSTAKGDFQTSQGGSVYAAGSGGSITGRGAGIFDSKRFGGCIVIDDAHKTDEALSDTIRESVVNWYYNTMQSRRNAGNNTPVIIIGQRTHERDLIGVLEETDEWEIVKLAALDEAGNALNPALHTKEQLLKMKEEQAYIFASQYQQEPTPPGGSVFKADWFQVIDIEPDIICSFITVDTAETAKTYNDATVFSLWGVYKVKIKDYETDIYALHWMDCNEIRVEPKDLEDELMQFYMSAMSRHIKPSMIAIEKKSTGVTLVSNLKKIQGIDIREIERTVASGSKATRFLACQQFVSKGLISLPAYGKHTTKCIEHCAKITLNNAHRFDDIADTLADAIKLALIDKSIISLYVNNLDKQVNVLGKNIINNFNELRELRNSRWK